MKKGFKLGNGVVVEARMIVWNKEKLGEALSNLTDYEEKQVHNKLVEMKKPASSNTYETLIAVEEVTQNSLSTTIPLMCPETANAILTAFTNEADITMGYYIYHAHLTHGGSEPVAFSGYDFAQSYSDILSMVRSEIFVINGKGTGFLKRKPEPKQYTNRAGSQPARALTTDERVAKLDEQFLEIWDEFRWLIPDGEYRVTPQFNVGPLDDDSEGAIANSLGHVMSIARANNVLEKLNVDDLPLLMPPSVTKAQTDARKREVLLDWLRENSDTLAEVMSLEPIEPAPSLEHRASHKAPVKSGSDLFRHE
ncbi:hypothetical protein KUL118_01440 [Tenacibaculum sp. KUL118]|nr:hypothetical protein KUL118_01440 [Tenacibaculum sp. KUL118]